MTKAEVDAACAKRTTAFPARTTPGPAAPAASMGGNLRAEHRFAGRQDFTLRYDNAPAIEYRFEDAEP